MDWLYVPILVTVPDPLLVQVDCPEKPVAVVVTFPFEELDPPPPPPPAQAVRVKTAIDEINNLEVLFIHSLSKGL